MRRKKNLILSLVLIVSIALSACANLLPQDEEPITGDFGAPYTPQEHQTKTFDALWNNLQDHYIYFESASIDWDTLYTKYTDQINSGLTNEQFIGLIHDLESELPAGTLQFQSRPERILADTADNSTYGGIGAFIGFQAKPEPHIVILAVMAGSPAEKAGIKAHDSLVKIDGKPITLEEGLSAVQRVRGPAGSVVKLTVRSPGKAERVVEVTRGQLASSSKIEAFEIKGKPFGYILFPPVAYSTMMSDISTNLQSFTSNKTLEGLILDLRVAGPGVTWPLQDLFTMFSTGEIGQFYDRKNIQTAYITGEDRFGSQTVPLIILVSENTTGSPEILAASLQAYERAIVIGEKTTGSVEVTTPYDLPDGSRVFIETTSFRLYNGDEIGNTGVTPSYVVDAGWDDVLPNNDPVLDKAIEILEAQP